MKKLNDKQREIWTDYCRKVAIVAATAFIFGQFVPGEHPDWRVVASGIVLSLILVVVAALLNRTVNIHD